MSAIWRVCELVVGENLLLASCLVGQLSVGELSYPVDSFYVMSVATVCVIDIYCL